MLSRTKSSPKPYHHVPRISGFTLVEMLVAVTLVLVMMVLFAEVFQIAGGAISKTRGIAENDQRSRTLQTIIKADLDKRTMRWVYPFAASEDPAAPESNIGKRQGFVYISENNPFNDLDDVLQFTVMATLNMRSKDNSPYYGQAMNLPRGGGSIPNFGYNNQPDADDADLNPNSTGLSTVAEVAYFVRNGNLYRRQLLIREPLSLVGNNPQPADNSGNPIFVTSVSGTAQLAQDIYPSSFPTATSFWADFDYSAVFTPTPNGMSYYARFLGSDSLNNGGLAISAIAAPFNRFGFSPLTMASGLQGRPKEFTTINAASATDDLSTFIGRFTLQECSDVNFRYPQYTTSNGNIPTDPTLFLTLDPGDRSVNSPDDFGQGIRRGEDLMLANVHAFDVEVWDDGVQGFVDVGDSTLAVVADYHRNRRLNSGFGPRLLGAANETPPTIVNAVYDTWHPKVDIDGTSGNDSPPFRPLLLVADSTLGGSPPFGNEWKPNYDYNTLGEIVFPTSAKLPFGQPFFYRCIRTGRSAGVNSTDYLAEPTWTRADGLTVIDGNVNNGVIWQAVDNRKPLKAIRITVRFLDTSTQQLRQLSILHSLVD